MTHHICLGFNPHVENHKHYVLDWEDKDRGEDGSALPDKGKTFGRKPDGRRRAEDCYVPGQASADYRPFQAAKLVPAGSDIDLTLHYTPNGKAVTDKVRIGFTVAKEPPQRSYVSFAASATTDPKIFAIPPNDPNWASPPAIVAFQEDVELVFMFPHMTCARKRYDVPVGVSRREEGGDPVAGGRLAAWHGESLAA